MIIYLCAHCAKELKYTERPAIWRMVFCQNCNGKHQSIRENAGEYRLKEPAETTPTPQQRSR